MRICLQAWATQLLFAAACMAKAERQTNSECCSTLQGVERSSWQRPGPAGLGVRSRRSLGHASEYGRGHRSHFAVLEHLAQRQKQMQ